MLLTHVITIASYGDAKEKSVYCLELAKALAASGRSVLLIDASPEATLTRMLGVLPGLPTATDMILSQREDSPTQYVLTGNRLPKSITLVPGDDDISQIEAGMSKKLPGLDIGIAMVAPIVKLRGLYEYILIDTPSQSVEPAVLMALGASNIAVLVDPTPDLQADVLVAQTEVNVGLRTIHATMPAAALAEEIISDE